MSLTRKVAYNTIIQIVGKVIVTAISLVTISYLTRYLGVAGYGNYTTIFAYVSFWAVIADFGFFWVLVRELSKPEADKNRIFNNVITLKIIFSLIIFTLCSLAGFLIPQYSWTLKIGISVIAASWFWMSLNATYIGLFQSQLEMYKTVLSEIVGRAVIFGGVVWLVLAHGSFQTILAVYILGNIINFSLNFMWGSKYIRLRPAFDFAFWKIILIDSLPLAILSVVGVIHFKIDTVILSLMKGPLDVGIYGVPFKILEIATIVPGIFVGNVFPILTRYYHSQDERLNGSIQKSFDFLAILAMPIMIWLAVLARPLINLIAGREYLTTSTVNFYGITIAAPQVLVILAIYVGISFLLYIFSNILTVVNKQAAQIKPMIIITVINVLLNVIFVPRYSYFASAIIACVTVAIMFVWWFILAHRHLSFKLNYSALPKIGLAGLAMGLSLYFLQSFNIFLASAIGAVVYFGVGWALKLFDQEMLKKLLPGAGGSGE